MITYKFRDREISGFKAYAILKDYAFLKEEGCLDLTEEEQTRLVEIVKDFEKLVEEDLQREYESEQESDQ